MEFAAGPSNCADAATAPSKACAAQSSSLSSTNDELQQGPRADHAALVQTHIQIGSGSSPSLSRSRARFPSLYASGTLSARLGGCTRLAVQSLGDKAASQFAVSKIHPESLSKACSHAGLINASKGFQGRGIFIQECGKIRTRERSHD